MVDDIPSEEFLIIVHFFSHFFGHFVAIVEYIIMTNHHQQRGQSRGGVKVWPEISHP